MNTKFENKETSSANKTFTNVCLASCQKLATQIESAKKNLVSEFRETFEAHQQLLNHVINQADALAWQTGYPHLFFPSLAAEKIQSAARWQARQQFLLRHTSLLALAA